jgi:hypothetical protein
MLKIENDILISEYYGKRYNLFEEIENTFDKILAKIQKYLKVWHLILNLSKLAAIPFHLNNRKENDKITVKVNG